MRASQVASDRDPGETVFSFSCAVMGAVGQMPKWGHIPPFRFLQFCGHPSTHFLGKGRVVHEIRQGEGEQGDLVLKALFALGQHRALEAIQGFNAAIKR